MKCFILTCMLLALQAVTFAFADDLDDPFSSTSLCTNLTVRADTPFIVKVVNYTRSTESRSWNAISLFLARNSLRPNCTGSWCSLSGPVCKLIECIPLKQDLAAATNDGKTIITNFVARVPADAGPDGHYYDLAYSLFDTRDYGISIPYVSNNGTASNYNSSLGYTNGWNGFNVTGTTPQTGTDATGFYDFEINPVGESYDSSWPAGLATVPCPAYGCARACVDQLYPELTGEFDPMSTTSRLTLENLAPVKECIDGCPGMDTSVNYCPDIGGETLDISQYTVELGVGSNPEGFVPDGCGYYAGSAFPKEAAAISASRASASSASWASYTATRSGSAASATSTSQASEMLRPGTLLLYLLCAGLMS